MLSRDQKYMLVFGVIVLCGVLSFWAAGNFRIEQSAPPPADDPQIVALREAVAKRFADPEAEMTEVTETVNWHGEPWRELKVRHLNAMGGRVFSSYLVSFREGAVGEFLPADDFMKTLVSADADEARAVAAALDQAGKIDTRAKKKAAH